MHPAFTGQTYEVASLFISVQAVAMPSRNAVTSGQQMHYTNSQISKRYVMCYDKCIFFPKLTVAPSRAMVQREERSHRWRLGANCGHGIRLYSLTPSLHFLNSPSNGSKDLTTTKLNQPKLNDNLNLAFIINLSQ